MHEKYTLPWKELMSQHSFVCRDLKNYMVESDWILGKQIHKFM